MSRIRGAHTKPEMLLRSALHMRGLRFRLHRRDLPGRPDIVFVRKRVVVFVHGCFWHCHDCQYSTLPTTRQPFWKQKLAGNVRRDEDARRALTDKGWRIVVVWECALRGPGRRPLSKLAAEIDSYIDRKKASVLELRGRLGEASQRYRKRPLNLQSRTPGSSSN